VFRGREGRGGHFLEGPSKTKGELSQGDRLLYQTGQEKIITCEVLLRIVLSVFRSWPFGAFGLCGTRRGPNEMGVDKKNLPSRGGGKNALALGIHLIHAESCYV